MEIKKQMKSKELHIDRTIISLVALVALLVLFNQYQLSQLTGFFVSSSDGGGKDLSKVDISQIKSTAHSVALLFPVDKIKTEQDAMDIMISQGTPEYGKSLGVSFDDPVNSLGRLAGMYRSLKGEVEKNNPEAWKRYLDLASKPVGISCEFCCGLKAIGIDKEGNSVCGCQHNPALLSVALYLTAYTDYSDAEILYEVMRWKALFFPRDMVGLAIEVAGKDISSLNQLPGMVGGC